MTVTPEHVARFMSATKHPLCSGCFRRKSARAAGEVPRIYSPGPRKVETCCACGMVTAARIYTFDSAQAFACGGEHPETQEELPI